MLFKGKLTMRVAIVHDFLREFGGAERVLHALMQLYPSADLYTLIANDAILYRLDINKSHLFCSQLNNIPYIRNKLSLIQIIGHFLWSQFDFRKYDLVISSSSYGLSNLIQTGSVPHIQYIHTPPKNIFFSDEKLKLQKILPYQFLISKKYKETVQLSKYILTNSRHIQQLLKKLFSVNATVIYPPITIPDRVSLKNNRKYFLSVGRLDRTKSVEIAIHACNKLNLPLIIVGEGKAYDYLKKIAGPTVEFMGFVPDSNMEKIYNKAKGFLFCAKNEDLGIAPVEAMTHGIPVIAYYGGGVKETMIPQKTGLFFYKHSVESLIKTLKKYDFNDFNSQFLYYHAKKFSEKRFFHLFRMYVNRVLQNNQCRKS